MDLRAKNQLSLIFKLAIVLEIAVSRSAAKFYEPFCHDGSRECLTATIRTTISTFFKGLPQYDIGPLDPFIIEKLELTLPGGLRIQIRDGIAKGLGKCHVDHVSLVDDTLDSQFHCNLTVKAKYRSRGKLLLFSINGDGDATAKIINIKIHNIMKLGSRIGPDGREYLVIKETSTDHGFDGRVVINLTNLLKGSPEAGEAILKFVNENWRMVADEFGSPFVDYGVGNVLKNVEKLFSVVSKDRLISGEF